MSDRLLVATRKGLFRLERKRAGWTADLIGFVGNPVTNALRQDDGVMFAALKLGHFGPKLHRSDDDGRTWREIAAPAFAADTPGEPSLFQIWSLEGGGRITRTACGSAPFPPACSAPTIAAKAGSS
jgi:hypothetical protein